MTRWTEDERRAMREPPAAGPGPGVLFVAGLFLFLGLAFGFVLGLWAGGAFS